MSALGDYVHLYAKNYNEYGINHIDEGHPSFLNFTGYRDQIKSRINHSKLTNTEDLQEAINAIFSPRDNSNKDDTVSQIQDFIYKKLDEKFGEQLGKIDWATGNIKAVNDAKAKTIALIDNDAKERSVYLKTILTRIQGLEDVKKTLTSKTKKKELQASIDEIYRLLNDILRAGSYGVTGQLKNIVRKSELGNIDFSYGSTVSNQLLTENKGKNSGISNLITLINSTLKKFAANPPLNAERGELWEYSIALAPVLAKNDAGKVTNEKLEKAFTAVQGGKRSRNVIDLRDWTDEIDFAALNFNKMTSTQDGHVHISHGVSQDKIDVLLEWESNIVPISAKNINFMSSRDVHLVSSTNLLYLLQDEGDFTTHYMNVIAAHPDGEVNAFQQAHETMRMLLLYKAFTGDVGNNTDKAEIFMVNDNSKEGGIAIYEIKDLITKAAENLKTYVHTDPNIETIQLKNNRTENGDYGPRITDLVMQMHQQKISAMINTSLL